MPTLSRFFVRSALVYLGIGITIGGLMLSAKAGFVDVRVWAWLPVHVVILINGWLVQLTLGVSYWILPRILLGERGRRAWAWAGFIALQVGLVLTLISALEPWLPPLRLMFAPAILWQVAGVALYAAHAWPRIRPAFVRPASTE